MSTSNHNFSSDIGRVGILTLALGQWVLIALLCVKSNLFTSVDSLLFGLRDASATVLVYGAEELVIVLTQWTLLVITLIAGPFVLLSQTNTSESVLNNWLVDVLIDVAYITAMLGLYVLVKEASPSTLMTSFMGSAIYVLVSVLAFRTYVQKRANPDNLQSTALMLFLSLSAANLYLIL